MLKNDGVVMLHIIKHQYMGEKDWVTTNPDQFGLLCNDKALLNEFSASGECWQLTGIRGTFDYQAAREFCKLLNKGPQGQICRYGVFLVVVSQKTVQIEG